MSLPEWAGRIRGLRRKLGRSGAELARDLGVSVMAVSDWELGKHEPKAEAYIRIGRLAGPPECWYFWERAGLSRADVVRAAQARRRREAAQGECVRLPIVKDAGAIGTRPEQEQTEGEVAVPREFCPQPQFTSCLRVPGNAMKPLFARGDLVAVDSSETRPERLFGSIVLAVHRQRGPLVCWLHRYGENAMLVSEFPPFDPTRPETYPLPVTGDPAWRIIGRVVFSVARSPQPVEDARDRS